MMNKYPLPCSYFWLTICLVLFLPLQAGCSTTQVEATAPTDTIQLTEIIDKSTQSPITENTITLRWETSDGEVLFFLSPHLKT
jgi:hypothetical protein